MLKSISTTVAALAALAALALGGSAIASAQGGGHAKAKHVTAHRTSAEQSRGERTSGTETSGAEADGPGGHQDPAGANVDHQFQGQE